MFRKGLTLIFGESNLELAPESQAPGDKGLDLFQPWAKHTYFCVLETQNSLMFPKSPSISVALKQMGYNNLS